MTQVTFKDIEEAYERIQPYIHQTPLLRCETLDKIASKDAVSPRKIFFKCENFQKVGAFKFRGACNAVFKLNDEDSKKGVVTHSSGNHAQALALAAQKRGIPAYIVMPNNAPIVKKQAVKGYGAKVYECEPTLEARESSCKSIQEDTGALLVHPFNDINVIAGQGTVVLELQKQISMEQLDAIITPVGGGGLLSGVSIAAKNLNKNIKVFAGEPEEANDAFKSLKEGKIVPHEKPPKTVADGLLTTLGNITFSIIQKNVDAIFTVMEEQIIQAMKLVWERMKIIIEPSSAVPVAVVLFHPEFKKISLENIVIVISGGNVDLENLPWIKK